MHLGEPQGKEGNQKIRDKCKQYLDRAEELQDHLDKKEVTIKLSLSLCVFMNMSKHFGPQWTESLFLFFFYLQIQKDHAVYVQSL